MSFLMIFMGFLSPKRSRRDAKDEKERVTSKSNSESAKQSDQDQKHQPRLQDTLPLESPLATDSRVENGASRKDSDKKPSGHLEGTKLSSDPTDVPRSRSYFQVGYRFMNLINLFCFYCIMMS